MAKIPEIRNTKRLSLDFIAGLIAGKGSFMIINQNVDQKVFVFQLRMHYNDRELVFAVRNSLGLREPVYEFFNQNRHSALLLVRKRWSIENIIIPAFDNRLSGLKEKQFERWKNEFLKEKKNWQHHYSKARKIPKEILDFSNFMPLDSSKNEEFKKGIMGLGGL